jgi:hypothetical protein
VSPASRKRTALGRQRSAARLHADAEAAAGEVRDDLVEVGTEIGLAPDEADLAAAEIREARGNGEDLGSRELLRPRVARARHAVLARLIAFHRQLPDREDRPRRVLVAGALVARGTSALGRSHLRHCTKDMRGGLTLVGSASMIRKWLLLSCLARIAIATPGAQK